MIGKKILRLLWGLSFLSLGVMASHALASSSNISDPPPFWVREDKDLSLSPLPCVHSSSVDILNRMNQNKDRGSPRGCNSDWVQRVRLSGGMNIDWFKFGNTNSKFMGINYQRFSLNDVYLNIAAEVNPWTYAFASLSYDTTTIEDNRVDASSIDPDVYRTEYSSAYNDNATGGRVQALGLEQAYVRFGNLAESPVFLQVGKQFQDFGRYPLHPITRSLTQSLSEISAASAKLGMILPSGVHGSIAVFNDLLQEDRLFMDFYPDQNKKNNKFNYGVAVGYSQQQESWGGQMGIGWIRNLIAANDIAYRVTQNHVLGKDKSRRICNSCYQHRVRGLSLYGDLQSGALTLNARYTRALQRLAVLDLPEHLTAYDLNYRIDDFHLHGGKPWAMGIQLGYHLAGDGIVDNPFLAQQVYIGYQASRETVSLGLPKYRWVLGYTVSPAKNTEFAFEWDRDKDFSVYLGGSGKRYHLVTFRSTVKFS